MNWSVNVPNLDPYLSLDFIIRNEVIIPSLVVLILGWITLKYQQRAENDENFITLKFKFKDVWGSMAIDDKLLASDYQKITKKEKYKTYLVIEFFAVVWFLHIRKKTTYSKEWEHNIKHVFKYNVIQTAFNNIVIERKQSFNEEWISYISKVIYDTKK